MQIEVCSIKMLKYKYKENELDKENTYYIINTSYPETIEFINELDVEDNVLVLNYDDVSSFGSNSFDEEQAQLIKSFVDRIPNNAVLYVCCDAGESRSAAVASAIFRYIGQDEMVIWKNPQYHPNMFVYEILSNIFGFKDTEDRLKMLQQISDNSLSNAIRNSRK